MSYKLKKNLANKKNYGALRNVSDIKYIVIHYTANDGDTDEANANYFKNNVVQSSAHYFVDDDSVTQSVPDNYTAWAVGGSRYSDYTKTGGAKYYGKCTNSNSISIELCDDVRDGVIYPSDKTIKIAIELTKDLMKKYNVKADHVIRHFDVNGKHCPAYWCCSAANNKKWLTEFHDKLTGAKTVKTEPAKVKSIKYEAAKSFNKTYAKSYTVTASSLNVRTGAGTSNTVVTVLKKGAKVTCHGYYTKNGLTKWLLVQAGIFTGYVSKKYLK